MTAGLRELAARGAGCADSEALVAAVALTLDARRPLWEREGALLRTPLSYPAWMARVHEQRQAGAAEAAAPEGARPGRAMAAEAGRCRGGAGAEPAGGERASGRVLYREMGLRHRRRVLAAAAELAQGVTDEEALLDGPRRAPGPLARGGPADAAELAGRLLAPGPRGPADAGAPGAPGAPGRGPRRPRRSVADGEGG